MAEMGQRGEVETSGEWEIRRGEEGSSAEGKGKQHGEVEEGVLWLPAAAAVPWFRQEDEEEVRKKQGRNRTGRVVQACYHACFVYGCEP